MPLLNESNEAAARDSLGGLTKVVASVAALRLLSGPNLIGTVQVVAGAVVGDGLGGLFVWNPTDVTADDGKRIVAPAVGPVTGRWNILTAQLLGIEQISGQLEAPTNKTYIPLLAAKYPLTINEVTIVTVSGTATVAFQINGVSITGLSALAVTSTPQTVPATALNTMNVGDKLTMVVSGVAAPVDLQYTVKLTR